MARFDGLALVNFSVDSSRNVLYLTNHRGGAGWQVSN
jgi:hypothetical protein